MPVVLLIFSYISRLTGIMAALTTSLVLGSGFSGPRNSISHPALWNVLAQIFGNMNPT